MERKDSLWYRNSLSYHSYRNMSVFNSASNPRYKIVAPRTLINPLSWSRRLSAVRRKQARNDLRIFVILIKLWYGQMTLRFLLSVPVEKHFLTDPLSSWLQNYKRKKNKKKIKFTKYKIFQFCMVNRWCNIIDPRTLINPLSRSRGLSAERRVFVILIKLLYGQNDT